MSNSREEEMEDDPSGEDNGQNVNEILFLNLNQVFLMMNLFSMMMVRMIASRLFSMIIHQSYHNQMQAFPVCLQQTT